MQPPILFIHPAQRILFPGSLSDQSVHEYTPKLLSEHFVIFARTDHFCHTPRQSFSDVVSRKLLLCRFSEDESTILDHPTLHPMPIPTSQPRCAQLPRDMDLHTRRSCAIPNIPVRSVEEAWFCSPCPSIPVLPCPKRNRPLRSYESLFRITNKHIDRRCLRSPARNLSGMNSLLEDSTEKCMGRSFLASGERWHRHHAWGRLA
jgi:hypothetical protein